MSSTRSQGSYCRVCVTVVGELRALLREGHSSLLPSLLPWPTLYLSQHSSFPLCSTILWTLRDASSLLLHGGGLIRLRTQQLRFEQYAIIFDLEIPGRDALQSDYILLSLATGRMPFPVLARPVRESGFDTEEVKRWLGQCDKTHGLHCWVRPDQRLARTGMRLIDTEQNCLVRVTGHCAYTALTYVWGPVDQPVLKKDLIMEWETPGHFRKIDFPKTISDAIKVCRMIGLKYLWVDSLCIVQDDPLAVQEQINSMSLVYSQAYLTMIAASGDDCDSGLPSVQAREPVQKTFQAGDLQIGTTFLSLKQALVKSKWNTRAWTLQEYALSRRCLVFTPRQVFFCCAEGIRREDVNRHLVAGIPRQDLFVMPVLRDIFLSHSDRQGIFAQVYVPLVEQYATRDISYASDIIKAFSGITGILEQPAYLGEFVAGIPQDLIEDGLAGSFHGECSRRPGFPSWSWAGWSFESKKLETIVGKKDASFHYFHHSVYVKTPMNIGRWISPETLHLIKPTRWTGPWSDRSDWDIGVRRHAEDVIREMNPPPGSMPAAPRVPRGEIQHVLFFYSCYAILDVSKYPDFRLNNETAGKGSAKPLKMLFIFIFAYPPMVMILPVQKDGDVLRRVDNPQLLGDKEWFEERPQSCLVYLA